MINKTQENRLRRIAERQGLKLHKVRRRDPLALNYGTYYLIDITSNGLVFPASYGETGIGASMDEIKGYMLEMITKRKKELESELDLDKSGATTRFISVFEDSREISTFRFLEGKN